jgi:arylsulfate sulfotransferase
MTVPKTGVVSLLGLLAVLGPAYATVQVVSLTPSAASPQLIGTSISWTVTATDTNPGPLAFQFNVAAPMGSLTLARDYNVGAFSNGVWTAPSFVWTPTGIEGVHHIQVIARDITSGEIAAQILSFQVNPLVTGSTPVVVPTAHPLVALFSAPSCPAGSTMSVVFQQKSMKNPAFQTNWINCHPPATVTFEIGGMYPHATYNMYAQTNTGGTIVNGPTLSFATGSPPAGIPIPKFLTVVAPGPQTDTTDSVLLHNILNLTNGTSYPGWATDLSGNVLWYLYDGSPGHSNTLTRPLPGGTMLWIGNGVAWNPAVQSQQYLRQIDLAGNIIRETNTGAMQGQLLAMGATDAHACNAIPIPAPVGAACLGGFHHDAIQTLPNGGLAVLADIEKIFPPGTQGDASGLPVDIVGDMIIVLDSNWRVAWYFDAFQHASGAHQLNIFRPAVLGETCVVGQVGCPPILLLSPGLAPTAKDWLHANSLYYWPGDGSILWSARNQDWVLKIDYNNGVGTGNILWRLGPCGDFTFNNIYNDPWPWFSHQHDASIMNNGSGPFTLFDNGNTRASSPAGPGSSTGCMPGLGSGNSRGMALSIAEVTRNLTPVLSQDLGVFSTALGSAQFLSDGNYFFQPGVVLIDVSDVKSYSIEILPTAGTVNGTQVLNLQGPESYRSWQMPSLYAPPTS